MRQKTARTLPIFAGAVLVCGLMLGNAEHTAAGMTSVRSSLVRVSRPVRSPQAYIGRPVRRPRHQSHHRRNHHHRRYSYRPYYPFFGFYEYDDYWYDYPLTYTVPGEYRRLPAFRMPSFFHYPGALGKDEALDLIEVSPSGPRS
jgi:hypothetical protein